ncbi:hypothetical protein DQY68_02340 [Salmonella enterica subsp. salamae]|nr:hypothetical protein [Salmonella enterica subsp. salamae]
MSRKSFGSILRFDSFSRIVMLIMLRIKDAVCLFSVFIFIRGKPVQLKLSKYNPCWKALLLITQS